MKQVRKRQEDAKQAVKAEGLAALDKLRQIQMVSMPLIVDRLFAIAVKCIRIDIILRLQEEAQRQRDMKQLSMEKMAKWKKENEVSMAEKERQRQLQVSAMFAY